MAITHQTGERDVAVVREGYQRAGIEARVEPFLFDIDREMKAANLVVSRAGATTLAELAAAGAPALLIPLPTATDDHQRRNAEVLVAGGAAEMIEQKDLSGGSLADRILGLLSDHERLKAMSEGARRFASPDASSAIARRVLELAAAS
jgi:UDP-N-acetylglucosamine--N-acetylmuramyl-(pentapeptide) pyrophosphoryl-undecaprenol N-acetylglucosamine transferase